MSGTELRALRRLRRESPASPFLFVSEREGPISADGFRKRLATAIGFPLKLHPHRLRHACGYKLANDGVDTRAIQHYLGHRNRRRGGSRDFGRTEQCLMDIGRFGAPPYEERHD